MTFTKTQDWGEWRDQAGDAGMYKIVHYDKLAELDDRPGYAAYVRVEKSGLFGNNVNPDQSFYTSFKAAKQACEQHARMKQAA